jgi:predicted dehydrogenase
MTRLDKNQNGSVPYCAWPTAIGNNPFTSDKDIIDNQVAIIEFENGVRATFHTNLNAGIPERRMYILGTEGCIRGEFYTGKLELRRIGFEEEIQCISDNISPEEHGGADSLVMDYLLKMMYKNAPTLSPIKAGIEAAATCFALDKAMLTKQVVEMTEYWKKLDRITD